MAIPCQWMYIKNEFYETWGFMNKDWSQKLEEWYKHGGKDCLRIPWTEKVEYRFEIVGDIEEGTERRVYQNRVKTGSDGEKTDVKTRLLKRVSVLPL